MSSLDLNRITYPKGPYSAKGLMCHSPNAAKVQAYITKEDKDLIFTVFLDCHCFAYIIEKSFHDIAQYIRDNHLSYGDSRKLINGLLQRATNCTTGHTSGVNDGRPEDRLHSATPSSTNLPASAEKAPRGRGRGGDKSNFKKDPQVSRVNKVSRATIK